MIEDAELRELFQTESEEHLQTLDDGLLRLETNPGDKAIVEEVFRAAHSLKGTARMLGVSDVETIAHQLEDELGSLRRGRSTLTSTDIDRYSVGLAAMRKLVTQAVTGTSAGINVTRVLAQMKGEAALETKPVAAQPLYSKVILDAGSTPGLAAEALDISTSSESTSIEASGVELAKTDSTLLAIVPESTPEIPGAASGELLEVIDESPGEATSGEASPSDEFKIQTMRVAPARLDALMNLASELTVTTTRVVRGITAFEEIGELWEEWNKDVSAHRLLWQSAAIARRETDKKLAGFHVRELARLNRMQGLLEQLKQTTYQDVTRLNFVADELEEGIRNVRLLPLSQIFNLFPRFVRDLARELNKEIQFSIEGGETAADKRILEELKDPLMHMMRNAIDHGIELPHQREQAGKPRLATIGLNAYQTANNVFVELRDDGRGLDISAIKNVALKRRLHTEEELNAMTREQLHLLIFSPGFSTNALVTDVSGRGVGMDVVRINVERLKGSIRVHSEPGAGTIFTIRVPSTLATTRVLLVEVGQRPYAIPVEWVQTMIRVSRDQIFFMGGRQTILRQGRALPVARLATLLELPSGMPSTEKPGADEIYVVLEVGDNCFAIQVDGLIDEQEVMLKPMGALLKRVRHVSGVTILGAGEICMVLNAHDLALGVLNATSPTTLPHSAQSDGEEETRKVILLAEDSITTRTQEKRILESAGYEVVTAVDGADAFQKLPLREYDAVVSDVEMPNMDGLTLASRIRENARYNELPIILVTSLASDEDKKRGIEVGANAYITKGTFEQKILIDTLRRLV